MRRITVTGRTQRTAEVLCRMLAGWRAFVLMSVFTFAAFVAAGLTGMALRASSADWPAGGAAAALPEGVLAQMAGMELPAFQSPEREGRIDGRRAAAFFFRFVTGINPQQPRSLLASELPGLESGRAVLLRPGSVGEHVTGPLDRPPLTAEDGSERGAQGPSGAGPAGADGDAGKGGARRDAGAGGSAAGDHGGEAEADGGRGKENGGRDMSDGGRRGDNGGRDASGGGKTAPQNGTNSPGGGKAGSESGTAVPGGGKSGPESAAPAKRKVVLIYHSHNRESWLPELGEDAKNAESDEINITLVGRRLAQRLEEAGIGALHSDVDYVTAVKDYRWELSYKYSKETVVEAMAEHGSLAWLFDIHRDAQPRGYTTATIDGKDYAQVYFIIGKGNPDWRRNEKFAAEIHRLLEERYPGISRGIWGKDASSGNGEYNQSLSPNSVLVEIGGIENTLEECYRTADALAEVIADLYRLAVETDAVAE